MRRPPIQQKIPEDAPYYIRWIPDRSPYAIELKLDLVGRIIQEFLEPGKRGMEVGGVLVGSFPKSNIPILRIEDFEMISRPAEEGPFYMLDPLQHQRFAGAWWRAKQRNKITLGFFRSHARPGPLKPSLADRSLLSEQFSQPVYALLLIQAREPYTAALFIAVNGQFENEPSVPEFRFKEEDFKALPEVKPDGPAADQQSPFAAPASDRWLKPLVIPLLIAIGGLAIIWPLARIAFFQEAQSGSNQLQLAVTQSSDRLLRISWNHSARELNHASGAALVINDGASLQEIELGPDELKLGVVDYQPIAPQVKVTIRLNVPGSGSSPQSVEWRQN